MERRTARHIRLCWLVFPLEEDAEEDEAIILKIVEDENGEEVLYDIEDDEEWEKVPNATDD